MSRSRIGPHAISVFVVTAAVSLAGCAGGRLAPVSPEEIPELEAQLAEHPNSPNLLLRYAAALYAGERCDSAVAVARRGMELKPQDALGPLVVGRCLEQQNDFDQAIVTYRRFASSYPDRPGTPAIRAQEMLALRKRAAQQARLALQREAELAQVPASPQTIAVLPLQIAGDTQYAPLSRGLAAMLTSDLSLIQRWRLVERLQVGALIQEMQLAETGRVDVSTAARVGRLLQAGRLVQGLAAIPEEGDSRLEATVVTGTGEVLAAAPQTGRFRDLLVMEKQIVVEIAARLGYQLSQAEQQMILENGTQNMTAFLAYSRGLEAADRGNYALAAQHFSEAVQADPEFQVAAQEYEAAVTAEVVEQATAAEVTSVSTETAEAPAAAAEAAAADAAANAVQTSEADVASTQSEQTTATEQTEQTTQQATNTQTSNPTETTTATNPPPTATGTIRIVFRLP